MSKAFFQLPQEVKMTVPHPPQGDQHRSVPSTFLPAIIKEMQTGWFGIVLIISGYSGIGVEQVSQMVFDEAELAKLRKNAPDFKESYDMGKFTSCSRLDSLKMTINTVDGELMIGSDESQRCPNIWLEEKYLPGLKSTSQEFMAEGPSLHLIHPSNDREGLMGRKETSNANPESTCRWYAGCPTWIL